MLQFVFHLKELVQVLNVIVKIFKAENVDFVVSVKCGNIIVHSKAILQNNKYIIHTFRPLDSIMDHIDVDN